MHTRLRLPTWESPAELPSGEAAGMYRERTFPGMKRCASGIAGPVASHAETEEHVQEWNRAIDLIEQRLEGDLDISDVARVALTSEYHFRRMFSTLAGMPLSEYVRRRRMTVATADVLAGEPVVDVAVRFGYGSAAAFTRAFKSMHGLTPGQARQPGSVLRSQPPLRFHLRVEGRSDMRHRIVDKDAFALVGYRTTVPVVHEGPNPAIVEFEKSIDGDARALLLSLSNTEPAGPLAVTVRLAESRSEGAEVEYWRAVATTAADCGDLARIDVPSGLWVVFEADGKFPEALQHLWADAATEWFPANPYEWIEGPELLTIHPDPGGESGRGELWLPIERIPSDLGR